MSTAATKAPSHFTTADRPTWDMYSRCIHCGLCLNYCPTYRVLGLEADSPRGRIYQVLQVDAGRLAIGDSFVQHIDQCLGCRACETACPSGVKYGAILERARAEIDANFKRANNEERVRAYFYDKVLRNPRVMVRWARVMRFYQRSGLQWIARNVGLLKLLGLEKLEAVSPQIEGRFFFDAIGQTYAPVGAVRARVAFMAGCIANVAFAELNRKTIRVLNENGVVVYVPAGQGCCGALHDHAGKLEDARTMARINIDALRAIEVDAIVSNAAGCGAMLKDYDHLLAGDQKYAAAAREFTAKVRDVNEFLAQLGLIHPRRPVSARVAYQDPCHLAHGQGIRSAPRELLKQVGVDLVEMPRADFCCGSAGTYNVTQNALSMQILAAKMDDVASTQAEILVTSNVGCMLQLQAGVRQRGLNMQVKHVIEVLDQAY
jgi:glycolate oxidase iron-sulfur subunit